MQVKFKKLNPKAVTPKQSKPGDAAFDLVATETTGRPGGVFQEYNTSLAVEIPEDHVGLLFARSGISDRGLALCNSVGVIDSGFRGELRFRFYKLSPFARPYEIGDRIGQLLIMPIPKIEFEEVTELSATERGDNGWGSTGN